MIINVRKIIIVGLLAHIGMIIYSLKFLSNLNLKSISIG